MALSASSSDSAPAKQSAGTSPTENPQTACGAPGFFLTRVRIREIRQKHGGLRPERAVQIFLRAAKHLFDDARAHALRALEQIFDLGKVFHVGRHADDLGALARKQIG